LRASFLRIAVRTDDGTIARTSLFT